MRLLPWCAWWCASGFTPAGPLRQNPADNDRRFCQLNHRAPSVCFDRSVHSNRHHLSGAVSFVIVYVSTRFKLKPLASAWEEVLVSGDSEFSWGTTCDHDPYKAVIPHSELQ